MKSLLRLLLLALCLAPLRSADAQVIPSSAEIRFHMTTNGALLFYQTFDVAPSEVCRVRVMAKAKIGDRLTETYVLKRVRTRVRRIRMKASYLPAVREVDGVVPIVNLITYSRCSGREIVSNVFARYVRCGQPASVTGLKRDRVSIRTWLSILGEKLNVPEGIVE